MSSQRTVVACLVALLWPSPEELAGHKPKETTELLCYAVHSLDGPYLLVLLWLAHFLLLIQNDL